MYAIYRKVGSRREQWLTGLRTWAYAVQVALRAKHNEPTVEFIVCEIQ